MSQVPRRPSWPWPAAGVSRRWLVAVAEVVMVVKDEVVVVVKDVMVVVVVVVVEVKEVVVVVVGSWFWGSQGFKPQGG